MRLKLRKRHKLRNLTIKEVEQSIEKTRKQLIALKAMWRGMKLLPPESSLMMLIRQSIEEIIDNKNIGMRIEEGSNTTKTTLKIIDADTNESLIVNITDLSWM